MLLAGDVGGTKTLLGLFSRAPERPRPIETRQFTTLDFADLGVMITEFISGQGGQGRHLDTIEAACFGVAGPVRDQVARLTNVPWLVDAVAVADQFAIRRVRLLNDLEAMSHAVPVFEPDEVAVLEEGEALPTGNAALIAPGTGLGEALLHNVDGRFVPAPSEGGHADFAARTHREIELLRELTRLYGRVHCEHVISGPGLVNISRFVHADTGCEVVDLNRPSDELPALISVAGLKRSCTKCVEALEMFVSAFGAEAGNLALRSVATAGVYLGGGIAPKILPALETSIFLDAFRSKPPMSDLLAAMPVTVILNPQAGLLGAAVSADRL